MTVLSRKEAGIRVEELQLFPGWTELEPEFYENEDGEQFVLLRGDNVAEGIKNEAVPGASWDVAEFERLMGGGTVDWDET